MAANLIVLFAKAPIPGRVKTRLTPAISQELAAELHSAFVQDMVFRFRSLEDTDFELHTDTRIDAWINLSVTRKLQISGDLGLRMIHALTDGLARGYRCVLILGSDAPTLPVAHVLSLLNSTTDVALGPAEDGGFYAIMARRVHPSMFERVVWSQPDTMARSLEAIHSCGLTASMGPAWHDVDETSDLRRLLEEPDLPPKTAACLSRAKESLQGID